MVGLKISSKEIADIVKILGLEDDEQGKVYQSLLSLGMATLGQISLISGLDYLKTQEALKVLIGSKLVGRIPDKVGRYFALEPFLKALSLAYDPITLISIRKEASNINEADSLRISGNFDEIIEIFKKNASDLENDFSQSMNPMTYDFKDLMNNFRGEIKSNNSNNIEIIQNIDKNINQAINSSKRLNDNIYTFHLTNLEKIPSIFETRGPTVRNKLEQLTQKSNEGLNNYQIKYNSELKSLDELIRNNITQISENTTRGFKKVEDDRSEVYNDFKNKIIEMNSAIDILQLKANQSESKFNEIKDGYKKIDASMHSFFTEINEKLIQIEPVLETLIDEIQRKKLFKGKDFFLDNLDKINEQKIEIQQLVEKNKSSLDKVNSLNPKLSEIENHLINATKNGLQDVKVIIETEKENFSEIFQHLKENINGNIKLIQDDLEKQKLEMEKQINIIINTFDPKVDEIKRCLGSSISNFVSELSNLVNETSNGFKNDLSSFIEEKKQSEFTYDSLKELLITTEKMRSNHANDLERNINGVANIETAFKTYLTGLNTFTSNFSEVQVETFTSTLNKAREIVNNRVEDFEKKVENEISALTYSIKEMRL
ncbi:MAG: helix-turn-helix domain-containing protein, partial [Candidatus Hodarchaeales archaeon]